MINIPTKKRIAELRSLREPNCVTICLPYTEPNTTASQNRIQLKNLAKETEVQLSSKNLSEREIRKIMRPIRELIEDKQFWQTLHEGLVILASKTSFSVYHVPNDKLPMCATIDTKFDVDILSRIKERNIPYIILALSQNKVQLFSCDQARITKLRIAGMPTNMRDSLRIDENQKWRETHQIAPASYGKGSEAFHGQYNVNETNKQMMTQFFRNIDKHLHSLLLKKGLPVVLAGVDNIIPIYRHVNTYPKVLKESIHGNMDKVNATDLFSRTQFIFSALEMSNTKKSQVVFN